MARMYRRKGARRVFKKKTRRGKGLKGLVKSVVKKQLSKEIERKYAVITNQGTYLARNAPQTFTSNILDTTSVYPLLPPITVGLENNQRIGDVIRPKSLVVKITLTANGSPTTNSSEQLWARLFILRDKSIGQTYNLKGTAVQPGTPVGTQLIDYGDGTSGAYQGLPGDNNYRVNRRQYHVYHDKLIKFQRGTGTLPQAANIVSFVGDQVYTSPLATHQLTLRVPVPSTLKYDNQGGILASNWPNEFAPFMMLGYNAPQQMTFPAPSTPVDYRVSMSWVAHLDFTDA